jgi:hypothetical protein
MKKILILFILIPTLFSCKKKEVETPEQTNASKFEECFKGKEFPQIPKKEMYIEGEFDGRYFSISESPDLSLACSIYSFYELGYSKKYANPLEWQGNGFDAFTWGDKPQFQYQISVRFPAFQGDSIAYTKYFEQFQKGKVFRFINNINPSISNSTELGTIDFAFTIFGGCSDSFTQNVMQSSVVENQTGSYCRVTDVKEYQQADKYFDGM